MASLWVAIAFSLLLSSLAHAAPLANGDFSVAGVPPDPFGSWTTELSLGDRPADGGGFAEFTVADLPDAQQLEQTFTLPANGAILSFEIRLDTEATSPEGSILDSFQVTLFDAGFVPLLPFNEFSPAFYSVENDGAELYDPAFVSVIDLGGGVKRVELDISSLVSQDVLFDLLLLGGDDSRQTTVAIDNVLITLVPEPSGLALSVILILSLSGSYLRRTVFSLARSRS